MGAEARAAAPAAGPADLAIVVPTVNERDNVRELVRRLDESLTGIAWEVVFVDDSSPDGTAEAVRALAREDARVRCVQRFGRRGLSSACIEGVLATSSPYCAVMDADLQHDERLLPEMLRTLERGGVDLVVGSRYAEGGSTGAWSGGRLAGSRAASWLARAVLGADVHDPLSGFFMLRREVFHAALPRLSGIGFKILLDVLTSSPGPLRTRELPYEFRPRLAGETKLDTLVVWEYLMLVADKLVGRVVPVRFLLFSLIGALGVVTHMVTLAVLFRGYGTSFAAGQAVATYAAMTGNFLLNNWFTYRDRRLRGWGLAWGWASFALVCSVGALANVGIASYVYNYRYVGWVPAALAGVVISSVWNYAASALFTWGAPRP